MKIYKSSYILLIFAIAIFSGSIDAKTLYRCPTTFTSLHGAIHAIDAVIANDFPVSCPFAAHSSTSGCVTNSKLKSVNQKFIRGKYENGNYNCYYTDGTVAITTITEPKKCTYISIVHGINYAPITTECAGFLYGCAFICS